MAYFPVFIDLKNQPVCIVGGGQTAYRKAEKLLPYEAKITVISPTRPDWIDSLHLEYIPSVYKKSLIADAFMVISATDDPAVNKAVSEDAASAHILCNVVDNKEISGFIFGSTILEGDLSIGISTSGASPAASQYLKQLLEQALPENIQSILDFLEEVRPEILHSIDKESVRSATFHTLVSLCMEKKRPLDPEEWAAFKKIYLYA